MLLISTTLSKEIKNIDQSKIEQIKFINTDITNQNINPNETIHSNHQNKRRFLSFEVDVSGLTDFEVGQTKTITAIPHDFSGVTLGSGCDIYIQVSNQCTVNQQDNICHVDESAVDVVNATSSLMTYNNDGQSYSHTFTVNKPGPISIFIYLFENSQINAVYYTNEVFEGDATAERWDIFNLTYGTHSQLADGITENFSYEFDTYIKGPTSEMVNFFIEYDDGMEITIDGVIQPFLLNNGTMVNDTLEKNDEFTASFSYPMNRDQFYRFQIKWKNAVGPIDWIVWYWNYTGQTQTIIPSTSYHFPSYAESTVINSYCPNGYTLDTNNECVEVCGDGIKIGNEKCDDDNTINNDGCSSDCASIEPNWVCSGGDENTPDTCTFCDNNNGWYQNDPNSSTVCVTQCGDGHESGNEKCDDGNTENGDGCNSDCLSVEDNWVCTGGSETSPDVCVYCNDGYYQDNSTNPQNCITRCGDNYIAGIEECDDGNTKDGDGCSSQCKIENDYTYRPIYKTKPYIITVQVVSLLVIVIGFSMIFLDGSPSQDVWAMVHYLQLFVILSLAVTSINQKMKNFIVSNAFTALAAYSLPLGVVKSIPIIKHLSFDQPAEYLRALGWSSGSSFVNNLLLFCFLLCIYLTHLLFCLLNRFTRNRNNCFSSFVSKVHKISIISIYIRIFIEIYMLTVLMILSEFKHYIINKGDDNFGHAEKGEQLESRGNYISLSLSDGLFILTFVFLGLVYVSWNKNKDKLKIDETCKTYELYKGILEVNEYENNGEEPQIEPNISKRVRIARLYYFRFLVRRLVINLIIVLMLECLSSYKISILMILKTAFLLYTVQNKSFINYKDQVVEILNELSLLILILLLNKYHSESDWTSKGENTFIGITLSHLFILLIISIVSCIYKIVKHSRTQLHSDNVGTENERAQIMNRARLDITQDSMNQNNYDRSQEKQYFDEDGIKKHASNKRIQEEQKSYES